MLIGGVGSTLTCALACAMPVPLARIVVVPTTTPVTGTCTDVVPAATVTVGGTVASAGLSVVVFSVSPPAGAGEDRLSVMFEVRAAITAKPVAGVKLNVKVTFTGLVSGANPAALAVIDAVPGTPPVICGLAAGIRKPAGMKTLGVIVATLVSLLVNVMVTPPAGASIPRLTATPDVWPGAMTGGLPMLIRLEVVAVMVSVALLAPVAVAVMVDDPAATPLIVNEPVVLPCAIPTLAGPTETKLGLSLTRFTASPPLGAG